MVNSQIWILNWLQLFRHRTTLTNTFLLCLRCKTKSVSFQTGKANELFPEEKLFNVKIRAWEPFISGNIFIFLYLSKGLRLYINGLAISLMSTVGKMFFLLGCEKGRKINFIRLHQSMPECLRGMIKNRQELWKLQKQKNFFPETIFYTKKIG